MSESTTLEASPPTRRRAALNLLGTTLGPFVAMLLVVALFWVADETKARLKGRPPRFGTIASAQVVLRDASAIGVAALGMTMIIIAGGIDLSAGTAISLSATVTAWVFREGYPATAGVLAALLTGCLAGFINGALISGLKVVPFIVTLGTMAAFEGAGRILAADTPIRAFGLVPDWITALQSPRPEPEWLVFSTGVWLMVLLAAVVGVVLKFTVFGRHVFALGSNEATARLCGVDITRTRILVYTLAGIFVGVAGLYQFAQLGGEGDPTQGAGKELEIIAAVVIGGGSLNGGRGSVLGTLSGALIMAVMLRGCVALDISSAYQEVLTGLIIVGAVTVDQIRQRRLAA